MKLSPISFIVLVVAMSLLWPAMNLIRRGLWKKLARDLGMRFSGGVSLQHARIKGTLRGVEVLIATEIRGSGRNKSVSTKVLATVPVPPKLPGLKISRENILAKAGKALGGQDIEIGDPVFDAKMRIQCEASEQALRSFLRPGLRQAILRLSNAHPQVVIETHACTATLFGFSWNTRKLDSMVRLMAEVCRQMSNLADQLEVDAPVIDLPPTAALGRKQ